MNFSSLWKNMIVSTKILLIIEKIAIKCRGVLFMAFWVELIKVFFFLAGYGTNSLSAMSKSTLDAHTHLRQPGKLSQLFFRMYCLPNYLNVRVFITVPIKELSILCPLN